MLKAAARKIVFPLILKAKIPSLIANHSKNRFLILNYHGVVSRLDLTKSKNHMLYTDFNRQIEFFKDNFQILNQADFILAVRSDIKPKKPTILITFDDGYENNYTHAFPILKKHNVPASIFPVTGLIGTANSTWYDNLDLTRKQLNNTETKKKITDLAIELGFTKNGDFQFEELKKRLKASGLEKKAAFLKQYNSIIDISELQNKDHLEYWKILSEEQIREMNNSGLITFGSHTVNHPNLDSICDKDAKSELLNSKIQLESILNKPIDSIAFPDGAYNESIKDAAQRAGYKTLFAVNHRCPSDKTDANLFKRFSISNSTTSESVIFNVCRAFENEGL